MWSLSLFSCRSVHAAVAPSAGGKLHTALVLHGSLGAMCLCTWTPEAKPGFPGWAEGNLSPCRNRAEEEEWRTLDWRQQGHFYEPRRAGQGARGDVSHNHRRFLFSAASPALSVKQSHGKIWLWVQFLSSSKKESSLEFVIPYVRVVSKSLIWALFLIDFPTWTFMVGSIFTKQFKITMTIIYANYLITY